VKSQTKYSDIARVFNRISSPDTKVLLAERLAGRQSKLSIILIFWFKLVFLITVSSTWFKINCETFDQMDYDIDFIASYASKQQITICNI